MHLTIIELVRRVCEHLRFERAAHLLVPVDAYHLVVATIYDHLAVAGRLWRDCCDGGDGATLGLNLAALNKGHADKVVIIVVRAIGEVPNVNNTISGSRVKLEAIMTLLHNVNVSVVCLVN